MTAAKHKKGLTARLSRVAILNQLGPGLITGAADDDPSGIATYSQAGAQSGFNLLWTMVLTFPLMVSIQMISAQIGRGTGHGLARNMGEVLPRGLVTGLVALLFLANTVNVGADLAAMGEAAKLVTGFGQHEFTIAFALVSLVLQLFIPYRRYARFLTVLTLSLFAYVALMFMIHLDWGAIGLGLIGIHADLSEEAATTIVAIFGTTISPYLFFWQSAQEVEEVDQKRGAKSHRDAPRRDKAALSRIRIDTIAGMLISNLIAIAIMISTAATLHQAGETNIQTAADAAKALEPLRLLWAMTLGWKTGLDNMPWHAKGFYTVIGAAVFLGLGIDYSGIDPIKALFWSAVLNGVIAVPLMVAMMVVASHRGKMGQFRVGLLLGGLGWLSTAVMAAATITMIYVSLH